MVDNKINRVNNLANKMSGYPIRPEEVQRQNSFLPPQIFNVINDHIFRSLATVDSVGLSNNVIARVKLTEVDRELSELMGNLAPLKISCSTNPNSKHFRETLVSVYRKLSNS